MTIEGRIRIDRGRFTLDAELTVPARGVTAIFGPSGCGKTTLLRAIAGLEPSADGYLRVGDEEWQSGERVLPCHRRSMGYVFQEVSLFTHLTVRRNLEYGFKRVPDGAHRVAFDEAVALLGVEPLLDRHPARL